MNSRCFFAMLAFVSFLLTTGCGGNTPRNDVDPPIPVAEALADKAVSANDGRERSIAGMSFRLPEKWTEIELTKEQQGFVDARFQIPTSAEPLTLTVTSVGGGIEANIDRWLGQVELEPGDSPKIEDFEVNGLTCKWVDLRGTFQSGMSGGNTSPQKNWRMIGIAIPHTPREVYLKVTGPRAAIAEVEEQIREFATSAKAE
ncbi:MAG: hypothetical protein ACKVT0_16665 [Planctomycetaceae bacterium]